MTPTGQVFVPTVTNEPDGDFEKQNALTLSTHWKEEWHTQLNLSLITLQPGSVNFAPGSRTSAVKPLSWLNFFFVESLGLCVRPMLLRSPTPRRGQRSKNVFITKRKQPIKKVAAPSPQLSVDVDLCAALGVSQSRDHTWLLAGATGSDIRASPRCGSRVPVRTTPTEHTKRKAGCHHRCSVLIYLIRQLRQYINWCPLGGSIALRANIRQAGAFPDLSWRWRPRGSRPPSSMVGKLRPEGYLRPAEP